MHRRSRPYALYSLLFAVVFVPFLACVAVAGKSLLWGTDAYHQQYTALFITRSLIREWFSTGTFTLFAPALGQGMDTLGTLSYYGLTDPLTWFVALLPEHGVEMWYDVLAVLYIYLSGLAFVGFVRKTELVPRDRGMHAALAGVVYVSSGYIFLGLLKNPYYAAGPMYMALLLLCVECVLRDGKCKALPVVTALAVMANFYLAFPTGILVALYTLARVFSTERGKRLRVLLRIVLGAGCGLLLSAWTLFPNIAAFLNSSRSAEASGLRSLLAYPSDYYIKLVSLVCAPYNYAGYWSLQSFSPAVLLGAAALFSCGGGAEKRRLRGVVLLCVLMLCVPLFGKVLNGGGYVTNRWSYAWAIAVCAMFAYGLRRAEEDERLYCPASILCVVMAALLAFYGVFAARVQLAHSTYAMGKDALSEARMSAVIGCVCCAAAAVVLFLLKRLKPETRGRALTVCVTLCCVVYTVGYGVRAFTGDDLYAGNVLGRIRSNAESDAARIDDTDGFYRVDTGASFNNHAMLQGFNGVGWYWSMLPKETTAYCTELALPTERWTFRTEGMAADPYLEALASVRYAVRRGTDWALPCGFEEIGNIGEKGTLYANRLALPLGRVFTETIAQSTYDALSPAEKRRALVNYAVIGNGDVHNDVDPGFTEVPWELVSCEKAELTEDTCSGKNGGIVTLRYTAQEGDAVWLYIEAPHVTRANTEVNMTFTLRTAAGQNRMCMIQPKGNYNYPEVGKLVYLGVSDGTGECMIRFDTAGTFTFENLRFLALPEARIREDLAVPQGVDTTLIRNGLTASVDAETDCVLQVAFPYGAGWHAVVNGENVPVERVGGMYMGVRLDRGQNDVRLYYVTPGLKAGALTSLFGLVLLVTAWAVTRRKKAR